MIANSVNLEIGQSDFRDGYYEDYADLVETKDDYEVAFGEDALTVWFQEYEIGPYALGIPQFEIPYHQLSRFLNERGEQLLSLPAETTVIGDFHEAQELWFWLMGGAPVDFGDTKTDKVDGVKREFYRVDDPRARTLDDAKAMLSKYVDAAFVEETLAQDEMLREFDGALYLFIPGRGDDLSVGGVDYAAQMDANGTSGKVIVTIHRQDFDDAAGDWVLTGVDDVLEFPFTLRGGHAVFSTMACIF